MRTSRAMTLVELVLAVIIIGLLAGVAVPRLSNALRRYRLDLTARRVIADIQLARSQAIRDQVDTLITFDLPNFRYTLQAQAGHRVASAPYTVTLKKAGDNHIRLESADFAGETQVTFNKFGIPSHSGAIVLTDGYERAVLTVSGTTGRVTRVTQPY